MRCTSATFVINLARRTDRRAETERELSRIGWHATFFPAVEPASAGDFPSVGARGCFFSHLAVLKEANASGVERLTILEDDIAFAPDFVERWHSVMASLESEQWSIFYAGHPIESKDEGLSLLDAHTEVRCTHFMVINGVAIAGLISGLETILSRPPGHPLGSPMHVDGAYSTIRAQDHALRTYAVFPSLGHQRPSRTDVGQRPWFDRIRIFQPVISILRVGKRRIVKTKLSRQPQ